MVIRIIETVPDCRKIVGLLESGSMPVAGNLYLLSKGDGVSYLQHALFHPLCQVWYDSQCYPYPDIHDWWDLRQTVKLRMGQGYGYYQYSDEFHRIIKETEWTNIPYEVIHDYSPEGNGNEARIKKRLKSLKDYTMPQMSEMISTLIKSMILSGVNSNKFQRILENIDYNP